ncbi:hypothetical protein [Motiliproteus coralliicola]|uniref:hypothetical protein n=1 Tax=Motiliproteus coralliicola TaxID=2283196 RepID=UPI00105896C5|nr:hypothetical protein [Motiliproteus coralliicola]
MPRIFLYLAAFALLGFFITRTFNQQPPSWEPFYQACMAGTGSTEQRCSCFADYVHDRLNDDEISAVMENRVAGASFQDRVEKIVQQGSLACH